MKQKQEVDVPKQTAVSTYVAPRGFEGEEDDSADIIIPMAKLIQPLSPEVLEGSPGIKPGCIINNITKTVLPEEFIPIFRSKTFLKFNPRDRKDPNFDENFQPGALIWRITDPNDPRVEECKFGEDGSKPIALSVLNFFSFFNGEDMPVVIPFMRTSYKTGKQLLSIAKMCRRDMFSKKYRLYSQKESNEKGEYFVLKFAIVGDVTPGEFELCENLWTEFSKKEIKVHEDDLTSEV